MTVDRVLGASSALIKLALWLLLGFFLILVAWFAVFGDSKDDKAVEIVRDRFGGCLSDLGVDDAAPTVRGSGDLRRVTFDDVTINVRFGDGDRGDISVPATDADASRLASVGC